MSRPIIGIDPGFSGAIAILNGGDLAVIDMPTLPNAKGKTELNMFGLYAAIDTPEAATVWVERVAARPGQGVSSVFRFGQQLGAIEMAATAHGHELRYATPASWKAYFGLSSDKGVARGYAMKRFPSCAHLFQRVKDDGRAEAALIALYGAEHSK